ncbi:MAG: phosphotransferase enzyme family protein [Microbacteriaceae bacterium]
MTESALPGGNMGPVARVGETVRRPSGSWTPTVHRLLVHLDDRGIDWIPQPVSSGTLDEVGREVLTFLPGTVPAYPLPDEVWSSETLDAAGWMLRAFHDSTLDFDLTDARWQQPTHDPVEVICHNDFAPYNFVFDGPRLTGVIDWDMASPGPRLWDLAYLAYRLVPLSSEAGAPTLDVASRLQRLLDAYGSTSSVDELTAMAATRLDHLAEFTDQQAALQRRSDLLDHAALYRRDAAALR